MIAHLKKSKATEKRIQSEIRNPYGDPFDVDDEEEEEEFGVVEKTQTHKSPPQTLGKRKSRGKDVEADKGQIRGKKKINSYFAPRTTPKAQPSIRSA